MIYKYKRAPYDEAVIFIYDPSIIIGAMLQVRSNGELAPAYNTLIDNGAEFKWGVDMNPDAKEFAIVIATRRWKHITRCVVHRRVL